MIALAWGRGLVLPSYPVSAVRVSALYAKNKIVGCLCSRKLFS